MTSDAQVFTSIHSRKLLPATVVGIIAVVVFAAVCWSTGPAAAVGLLMLSFVIDYVIHRLKPESRLSAELALCEYGKAFLIAIYIIFYKYKPNPWGAWFFSGLSLVAALLVTAAIAHLSVRAMRDEPSPPATSLAELRNDKALALLGLVLAFLHITYFLSFALAFTDQFAGRALWAFDLVPAKTEGGYGDPSSGQTGRPLAMPAGKASCTDTQKRVRKFYFVQSATTMACTVAACSRADADPALQKLICSSGVPGRRDAFKNLALAACGTSADAVQVRAAAWNARELYELRNVFRTLGTSPQTGSYLIEIRGHANDAKLDSASSGYASNLEISKQRAEEVERLLQEEFRETLPGAREPSVRWLAYGVSNEDAFLDGAVNPDAEGLSQKLSVEVFVQPVAVPYADGKLLDTQAGVTNVTKMLASSAKPRDLELIDYLYFTIYTITTTGYGDIIPVSSWAKFLASIANLIELLFVVVLVNVVANVRPPAGHSAAGGEDAHRA